MNINEAEDIMYLIRVNLFYISPTGESWNYNNCSIVAADGDWLTLYEPRRDAIVQRRWTDWKQAALHCIEHPLDYPF